LIEDALAAGRVAVAVTSNTLVNVVVGESGIKKRFDTSFETELGVINLTAGLDEFGHSYAYDVDVVGGHPGWFFGISVTAVLVVMGELTGEDWTCRDFGLRGRGLGGWWRAGWGGHDSL
jgi:hypothetical protein